MMPTQRLPKDIDIDLSVAEEIWADENNHELLCGECHNPVYSAKHSGGIFLAKHDYKTGEVIHKGITCEGYFEPNRAEVPELFVAM